MPTKSKSKRSRLQHAYKDVMLHLVHDPKDRSLMVEGPEDYTTGWYPYGWWQSNRPQTWALMVELFQIKE